MAPQRWLLCHTTLLVCAEGMQYSNNLRHHPGLRHLARSIRTNLHRGLGTSCKPAGTEVLVSAPAHNNPTAIQGGAECHHCEHPQLRCSLDCRGIHRHQCRPPANCRGTSQRVSVLKEPVLSMGQLFALVGPGPAVSVRQCLQLSMRRPPY